MASYLFIRFRHPEHLPEGGAIQWQAYGADGRPLAAVQTAMLPGFHTLPEAEQTIVWLEGHRVLVSEVTVAREHVAHLRSAVMHALEDQLAESVEDVHLAIDADALPAITSGGITCRVGVIRDALMRQLMHALADADLDPSLVTADTLVLPSEEGQGTLLLDDGQVLFRLAPAASSLEPETFLIFLDNYLTSHASLSDAPRLRALKLYGNASAMAAQKGFIYALRKSCDARGVKLTMESFDGDAFSWLCRQWLAADEPPLLNFLQGAYRTQDWMRSLGATMRKAVRIAAAWLVVQAGLYLGGAQYLTHEAEALHAESENLYRQHFPRDSRIVDLKVQTEQHLKGASAQNGMLPLLAALVGNGDAVGRLDIASISYDAAKDELVVEVTAPDAATLDQYKQQAAGEFAVEIGSVTPAANGTRGQIKIRKAG